VKLLKWIVVTICLVQISFAQDWGNEARRAWSAGDYEKAIGILQPYANKGISSAQLLLGAIGTDSRAPSQYINDSQTEYYLKEASKTGDPRAIGMLGTFYASRGRIAESVKLLESIAKYNEPTMLASLASSYCSNFPNFSRNMYQCAHWVKRAKDAGSDEPLLTRFWKELELWKYL
jgi:TPR repeat protein